MKKIKVGIVGVSGYTGLELLKILLNHPKFQLTYVSASAPNKLTDIFPNLSEICDLNIEKSDISEIKSRCELVFLALPHTESMKIAQNLRDIKIVDLSADYRLSLENYEKNYCKHLDISGLKTAVYGLLPMKREEVKRANLVANPGCYPTCSLLALLPFREMIEPNFCVMIDAKSGVSGAGKGLKSTSHFVNVNENLNAYSPLLHRHAAEISQYLGKNLEIMFVPHLAPLTRGMLVSAFFALKNEYKSINPLEILRDFYKNEKFIRIKNEAVNIKNVAGTHFCDIFGINQNGKIWLNSAIDNLLRGASSQAVANANLMCGFDENIGLPNMGSFV